ncbi:MAG TPA: hypothetical protein VH877_15670 [Polyangia bacterium]|jgi:hypothetical protein|nr:hypothetical protein [Polyangia bacterium]
MPVRIQDIDMPRDGQVLYIAVPLAQVRRYAIVNFGDRPRPR